MERPWGRSQGATQPDSDCRLQTPWTPRSSLETLHLCNAEIHHKNRCPIFYAKKICKFWQQYARVQRQRLGQSNCLCLSCTHLLPPVPQTHGQKVPLDSPTGWAVRLRQSPVLEKAVEMSPSQVLILSRHLDGLKKGSHVFCSQWC